ncbi:DUF5675 domain-containing protein [Flavobacterium gelidilacus]|uniref:DUF5675 family protein n=1 Tax=Flavobacterium gelidilacus TaxID=206041 RepID=UPI000479B30C|nr:DUF5675 family protein [Flavobacterium gelidilacus]
MKSKIIRVAQGKESTLSQLYINGIFQCYLLEDKIREVKIPSQTAIPKGDYTLKLNTSGAKNVNYKKAFGKLHQGMIEIISLPNFNYVYIHTGNTIQETAGCPLCGFGFQFIDGDYRVTQSVAAYKMIYPKLVLLAKETSNTITIENNFQF